jgi:hypothetical protein
MTISERSNVSKADIDATLVATWTHYRKRFLTPAIRMSGPFTVQTREGSLTCPDGYLAVDAHGWPYPIAADEFERIYEPDDEAQGRLA